ncbi:tyrosine-protein phosphatase [uncultured Campylobacter sp.]|uniref:tyrosine-protein phosphatase n=1 Tax=uncultured Campylobacter sp. TaxID=218934 RepID=UPI0028E8E114|nr:tyrosine-protein phosphatase [uncultured Campylobacter sp.]
MKFKTLALAVAFFFATGVNAELVTEANSINFIKTNGAELNLADAKDAKFQNAHFKSSDTAARSANPNSSQKATLIDEAKNFYRVDELLFRSAQLDGSDAAKLHELGIKSIVNLRHFSRGGDRRAFGDQFWLANKPLQSWEIKPAQIADVLRTIRERQKEGAVLVHCYHGADRTGLVVAMYRVIYQGWSLDAARSEMIDGGYGFHSMWQDIAGFLTPQNEALVRAELGI